MNIYDALSKDHREFERLLDQLLTASKANDDGWKGVLDELRRSVIAHAHAEEAVLYNALRDSDEAKGLVFHSYGEHAMAETEIRTLSAAKLLDANWTTLVEKFRKDLLHHIKEEESRVFDAARKVIDDKEATQLGAAFVALKAQMAKDGDSMLASTVDLVINLLPPRLSESLRAHAKAGRPAAKQ